jgi:hypothetical protein
MSFSVRFPNRSGWSKNREETILALVVVARNTKSAADGIEDGPACGVLKHFGRCDGQQVHPA